MLLTTEQAAPLEVRLVAFDLLHSGQVVQLGELQLLSQASIFGQHVRTEHAVVHTVRMVLWLAVGLDHGTDRLQVADLGDPSSPVEQVAVQIVDIVDVADDELVLEHQVLAKLVDALFASVELERQIELVLAEQTLHRLAREAHRLELLVQPAGLTHFVVAR